MFLSVVFGDRIGSAINDEVVSGNLVTPSVIVLSVLCTLLSGVQTIFELFI